LIQKVAHLERLTIVPPVSPGLVQQLVQEKWQIASQLSQQEMCFQAHELPQLENVRPDPQRCTNGDLATSDTHEKQLECGLADQIDHRILDLSTLIAHVQDALIDLMEDVQEVDSKFTRFVATVSDEPTDCSDGVHTSLKHLEMRVAALEQHAVRVEANEKSLMLDCTDQCRALAPACDDVNAAAEYLSLPEVPSTAADLGSRTVDAANNTFVSHVEQRLQSLQERMEQRAADLEKEMSLQILSLASLRCNSRELAHDRTIARIDRQPCRGPAVRFASPRPVVRPCSLSEEV